MEIFGHYIFLAAGSYFTSALCLILAILVIQANPRSKSCRLTFLFNLSVSFWAFFFASLFIVKDGPLGHFVCRMLSVGTVLLSAFVTHLTFVQVKLENKRKRLLQINYAISAVLIVLLFIPHLMIKGNPPKLDLPSYLEGGPLFFLIPLQLLLNFIYSCYHLVRGIRKIKGFRRNQLSLLLAALFAGYSTGVPAYLLVFNFPIKPVTSPLVCLYPIILTYAIVKHRFLDIEKLVKNTLVFSLLFIMLLLCVSVILFILKEFISRWIGIPAAVSQGIAIALAIGLYAPLKEGLSRLTNRTLFQHSENPEIIFRKLSQDILKFPNTIPLAQEVTNRVAEILALDRIYFYVKTKRSTGFYELMAHVGKFRKKQIHQSKQLVQYLERSKEFLVNPLTEINQRLLSKQKSHFALANLKEIKKQATRELAALGGVAAFPIFVKDTLRGILVAGRKKSDATWRDEEFKILKSFTRHLSLALGNAEYAEAIHRSREELTRSERDASAGALIAGVDHEAKNPLHAMALSLSSLRTTLSDPGFMSGPTENIEKLVTTRMQNILSDAEQVNAIIQHLSDLADRKPLQISEGVRPSRIAAKVIQNLIQSGNSHRIRIESKIPEYLSFVCDPDAVYEIFLNLIRNAQQSIPDEGQIVIDSRIQSGEIVVEIRDTGIGIPKESLQQIFEPFFSTKQKELTEGTAGAGMGLFIVKEYMLGMGGRVEVESKIGEGTVFRLFFPRLAPIFREAA